MDDRKNLPEHETLTWCNCATTLEPKSKFTEKKLLYHPRCFGQGIYLVLWTGEKVNLKDKAGKKISTAQQLRHHLQEITNDRAAPSLIHVFVLDISI